MAPDSRRAPAWAQPARVVRIKGKEGDETAKMKEKNLWLAAAYRSEAASLHWALHPGRSSEQRLSNLTECNHAALRDCRAGKARAVVRCFEHKRAAVCSTPRVRSTPRWAASLGRPLCLWTGCLSSCPRARYKSGRRADALQPRFPLLRWRWHSRGERANLRRKAALSRSIEEAAPKTASQQKLASV